MSNLEKLKALMNERLNAAAEDITGMFERTTEHYREELAHLRGNGPKIQLASHRTDVPSELSPSLDQNNSRIKVEKEEPWTSLDQNNPRIKVEKEEPWTSLDQNNPRIKVEKEEPWTSLEGQCFQGAEGDDTWTSLEGQCFQGAEGDDTWTSLEGQCFQGAEGDGTIEFTVPPFRVKSEDGKEKPQSSQVHLRHTEQSREASSSPQQMETETEGEDCGGPEPTRNQQIQADAHDEASDSSDTENSDDY